MPTVVSVNVFLSSCSSCKLDAEMEKQQAQVKRRSGMVASSELVRQLLFASSLQYKRTADFAIHAPDHPRDREHQGASRRLAGLESAGNRC